MYYNTEMKKNQVFFGKSLENPAESDFMAVETKK